MAETEIDFIANRSTLSTPDASIFNANISHPPLCFQSKTTGGLAYPIRSPFQNVVPHPVGVHLHPGHDAVDPVELVVIGVVVLPPKLEPALVHQGESIQFHGFGDEILEEVAVCSEFMPVTS